ncbi:EthD domain-containing protein [Beijerinckia sp. L45]|uniref:EthD domain-containing protein n=1 Tax=Beijerinckia sp. L45 TaxID=1641855 RepID=UPI00131C5EA1|nr:EthD domain-containing protein [Beijerinckia sp. L45]
MIKMTLLISRKAGMSLEDFKDYWLNKHLPVVQSVPEVGRYSKRYVQQYNTYSSPSHTGAAPFDGIAEAWFDSLEDALALTTSDNWLNVVKKDDLNFLDVTKTQMMLSEEKLFPDA